MKKTPYILIANWKTNPRTLRELEQLQKSYWKLPNTQNVQIVCAPPPVYQLIDMPSTIAMAAQNVMLTDNTTGNWNTDMLRALGIQYCIIGHSEQRALGETDEQVRDKIRALLDARITPVVCVGESIRDERGKYATILCLQIRTLLSGFSRQEIERIIIAYEPLWAIGARALRHCTPDECNEAVILIRREILDMTRPHHCVQIPTKRSDPGMGDITIIYGGSVDQEHAVPYLRDGGVTGFLVGRASLDSVVWRELVGLVDRYGNSAASTVTV